MPNVLITRSQPEDFRPAEMKIIEENVLQMVSSLAESLKGGDKFVYHVEFDADARKDYAGYSVWIKSEFGDSIGSVNRHLYFTGGTGDKPYLYNNLLILLKNQRGSDFSKIVNRIGAKILHAVGGDEIKVTAALDTGGHVWLRRGFWPDDESVIDGYVQDSEFLSAEEKASWLSRTTNQKRDFVLSDTFKEKRWRKTFLDTHWRGSLSLSDNRALQALTGLKGQSAKAFLSPQSSIATVPAGGKGKRPLTSNQQLNDALLRHQINLMQYSEGVQRELLRRLDASEPAMAALLKAQIGLESGLSSRTDFIKFNTLMKELADIRGKAWKETADSWLKQLEELIKTEAATFGEILTATVPVVLGLSYPTPTKLNAILSNDPFQGRLLNDWVERMTADDMMRVTNVVRSGIIGGDSMDTIAKRLVGTKINKGKDGVVEMSRAQLSTMVRTATMGIANAARQAVVNENTDLILEEKILATLDSRTSMTCKGLDGKVYDVGKGPHPPLHFNCRSIRIQLLDPDNIAQRPSNPFLEKELLKEFTTSRGMPDVTSRDNLPRGTKTKFDEFARKRKREIVGPIPANETYQTWLGHQSTVFQDHVLGTTKAKLFRDGGLTLDRFITDSGRPLSLSELAVIEREAFIAAGLNPDKFR